MVIQNFKATSWFYTLCVVALLLQGMVSAHAQTRTVDSLRRLLYHTEQRPSSVLLALCKNMHSLPADSLLAYAAMLRQSPQDADSRMGSMYFLRGLILKGNIDSAKVLLQQQLSEIPVQEEKNRLPFYRVQSQIWMREGRVKDALQLYYSNLERAKKYSPEDVPAILTTIGLAHLEVAQYQEALKWTQEAHRTAIALNTPQWLPNIVGNTATIFNNLRQYDSALVYIDKAIAIDKQQENLTALCNAYNIKASTFISLQKTKEAEALLLEALAIRKQIGDPFFMVSDMCQLAEYYTESGQPHKAISLIEEGLAMARRHRYPTKVILFYTALANAYARAGDATNEVAALRTLVQLKDSLYENSTAQELARLQAKYELQAKENTIIRQEARLSSQRKTLLASFSILALSLVFGILYFHSYRKRQKVKTEWQHFLQQQKAREDIRHAEETERKRIAADLHDSLGSYAASMASDIHYIFRNETRQSPALHNLKGNAENMVARLGDTIWALKKEALSLTAISDRVKVFIQRMKASYPDVELEVIEDIQGDDTFTAPQAFDLLSIIQEAVTNALKHSGTKHVAVQITRQAHWEIDITDQGHGMKENPAPSESGSGMSNILARAAAWHWSASWKPATPQGTVFTISPTAN